mmetsp:Transcript_133706/g.266786  ORF Transcript_133706/g.266786 Transcript_133706/m.266786 type:complete len:229 (+) Transcript_133706:96-782(+)
MSEAAKETKAAIKGVFRDADENGDRFTSKDELEKVVDAIGAWSDKEFDELYAAADSAGLGKMLYEESLEWDFDKDEVAAVLGERFLEDESSCEDWEATCQICLRGKQEVEPLLRPCLCDGSVRWAHSACIVTWLQTPGFRHSGGHFNSELDGLEFKGCGLVRVFFKVMGWMFLVGCVEGTKCALQLLPFQAFSEHGWFVMITGIADFFCSTVLLSRVFNLITLAWLLK